MNSVQIHRKWKVIFPSITPQQSNMCEKLALDELNGKNMGSLKEYMDKNNIEEGKPRYD